jgi:hypothetical protein
MHYDLFFYIATKSCLKYHKSFVITPLINLEGCCHIVEVRRIYRVHGSRQNGFRKKSSTRTTLLIIPIFCRCIVTSLDYQTGKLETDLMSFVSLASHGPH